MLITNRQPARSAPDPGPLPGNIITSWQKNSEVIHYQILKYVFQFDNIQRYTEVSWKESAQDDQIPHVNSWIRFWAWGETFSHKQSFPLFCGVLRGVKRAEPTARRWKTQGILPFRLALRNQTILSSDQTERHQRDTPPEGCQCCGKKIQKT